MKLNPEDLTVSSFQTTGPEAAISKPLPTIIVSPNDPTAATWCYICPVESQDARCF
ncbi:MAG TPA: hypothetical protein VFT45_06510 [Longimicrobium sp.]|nr:hypothetical protein [Longimicrobium sp.]